MPVSITIKRLSLTNYRNYKEADFALDGKSGQIAGANRVGKTNALEAVEWALTDKLLGGSSDVAQIKPLSDTKAKACAEIALDVDGAEVTLRKEFYETWVRHGGSAEATMEGHTTDYFVNGAKQGRLKDFQQKLEDKLGVRQDMRGVDAIQLLTDPFYLSRLCTGDGWKDGRAFIIDLIGDVRPEDVFKRKPEAAPAKAILERHQYDDAEARREIKGLVDAAKKDQIAAQGAIDEFAKTARPTDEEAAAAKERCDEADRQAAQAATGDTTAMDAEINRLTALLNEQSAKYAASLAPKAADRSALDGLEKACDEAHKAVREAGFPRGTADTQRLIKQSEEALDGFRAQLLSIKKEMSEYEPTGECPVCKRPYDREHLEAEKADYLAHKIAEGNAVQAKGEQAKKDLEGLRRRLKDDQGYNDELSARKADLDRKAMEADEALDEARRQYALDVQPTPDEGAKAEADRLREAIAKKRAEKAEVGSRGAQTAAQIKADAEPYRQTLRALALWESDQSRKKAKEADLAKAQQAQADAEGLGAAVALYVRTKLEMLDERVAKVFGGIRFRLVRPNIKSGSYDEVCEPYIYDLNEKKSKPVLWASGSKSEQISTGCAIIKAVREAMGWPSLPILFDEGGELDAKSLEVLDREIGSQIISAKVDDAFAKPTFIARK